MAAARKPFQNRQQAARAMKPPPGVAVETVVAAGTPLDTSKKGASSVIVACKLPHGLQLRLFKMISGREPVLGGGVRDIEIAQQVGQIVTVMGTAHGQGEMARTRIIGGFALTPGVDREFWLAWLEQNREHDAVVNGLIFAHETRDGAGSEASNRKELRHNLEPLDVSLVKDKANDRMLLADPRAPRPRREIGLEKATVEDLA